MKVSEFRQLIKEEVRKVLAENQSSLPTLEDIKAQNPYLSVIAIADKFVGNKKDIIISKTTREKLKAKGYTPVGMCTEFNSGVYSVEFIQSQINEPLNNKNYTVDPDDLKLWKSNPVQAYKEEGISYRHTGPEGTKDSALGQFGVIGGSEFRPTPLYMSTNGINITGADNGKLIGFIFSLTQKTVIAVK
jgi:hypothetical protein